KSTLPDFPVPTTDSVSLLFPATPDPARRAKTALVDAESNKSLTYGQLQDRVGRLAAGLQRLEGWSKWNVVALFSRNHLFYGSVVFATLKAGGAISPANPTYTSDEFAYQLRDSRAKYIITTSEFLPVVTDAASKADISRSRIFLLDPHP
ncbi:hypothetical protein BDK51DRAFT_9590, partial [Blyttiomyces helicus]